jgi:crotonobetainyl-CoA hydratase
MMTESVTTAIDDEVLVITLDRPKANAIDIATSNALYQAFKWLADDPGLRVGIVTGAGERFFSAGWDLKAGEAIDADHGPGGFAGLTEYFTLDKPVIAAVNGLAMGGGFELALAADLVVAADHAEFALPEATLGMIPDSGGLLRLARRLPAAIASEMLFTGRRISAAEAQRWGLVNRVTPSAVLLDIALELARRVCYSAPLAIAAIKEVTRATEGLAVPSAYRTMREGDLPRYRAMLTSMDAQEGPRAFAEKRPPVWQGR